MILRRCHSIARATLIMVALGGCASRDGTVPERVTLDSLDRNPAPSAPARITGPERVTFDSLDRDPATGAPVRITGLLFRPKGAIDARRPAVIALHGCGGMYSTLPSRRDRLSLRHQAMADLLTGEGYLVLFPDSFRSRAQEEICTIEARQRTINQGHRLRDAQGALAYLQARADVAPDRIAVLGWSHGGSAVLATQNAKSPPVARWQDRSGSPPYFRAGVAFYPGCIDYVRARTGYAAVAPLTLFVGAADDWTAPQPCIDLAQRLIAGGEPVTITVYPDTYHGFDGPVSQGRLHLDMPNGVNPGGGVTVAPNPAARDDAYAKLKRFLRAEIGGS
jgi:dienelactone hydrolase